VPTFEIRTEDPAHPLPRNEQLAWRFAELAAAKPPIDRAAAAEAACRIIDNAAVGIAAIGQESVRAARAQALAHARPGGASVLGMPADRTVECAWAAWANGMAVRELDLHDNFYGFGVAHPADAIPALLAVAEQCRIGGEALQRAILTAYEIQVALGTAIDLNAAGVDHVAHQGPAVAAGLGTLLGLDVETIYQAVNQAAHVSCAPLQARKGAISSWKAAAPAHVGKLSVEAVDRAMRGQTSPTPIYEGSSGLLATLFRCTGKGCSITLPAADQPRRAILLTYPKAHAAGYHAQALIDLAFRMRGRIGDPENVRSIVIHTKDYTHNYIGTGAGDPEKMNPFASRETLDHSIMYIFAVALMEGRWHHIDSYRPETARRPEVVRLWHKISTAGDPDWNRRFKLADPLQKDHGGRVVIAMQDGTEIIDELAVPDSHPRGARPFGADDYARKFRELTEGLVDPSEAQRFLAAALAETPRSEALNVTARPEALGDAQPLPAGIFDFDRSYPKGF
jgi:2-methylcitrate dehydratase